MSATFLDTLSGLLTPDMIGKAASALGESEPAVSKGMSAVFPVLLSSVANRADDPDFASTLFNLVRDPANDGSLLGNVASLLGPGASSSPMMALGGKLLGSLFGNNLGSLESSLGGYAGVKPATSHSMLSFAAPLLLSVLGKAVKSGNLNLSSLIGMLTGQKDSYARALPGPLSRLDGYFASPVRAAYAAPPPVEEKKSIWRWLLAAADRARGAVAAVALHGTERDGHPERRDRACSGGRVRPGARADARAGSRGCSGRGDPARKLLLRS